MAILIYSTLYEKIKYFLSTIIKYKLYINLEDNSHINDFTFLI